MKFKTTKKAIQENYTCYCIGYCDLQHLLSYFQPVAYTSGVYGWNSDIYTFDGIAIVTGYRPFGKHVDYELIKTFDNKAREFYDSWNINYSEKQERADKLIKEFIKEISK